MISSKMKDAIQKRSEILKKLNSTDLKATNSALAKAGIKPLRSQMRLHCLRSLLGLKLGKAPVSKKLISVPTGKLKTIETKPAITAIPKEVVEVLSEVNQRLAPFGIVLKSVNMSRLAQDFNNVELT